MELVDMTQEDIIRMAREAGFVEYELEDYTQSGYDIRYERFAALVAAAEREACAKVVGELAQTWWSIHCASNKHMETTRKAHDAFCALQAAIRARGQA
jgi:hypothetical protein